jgi:uncharacterized protein (DUF305 family)
MTILRSRHLSLAVCAGLVVAAPAMSQVPGGLTPAAQAAADSGRPPYTDGDVRFISGMIAHHAQAVLISGWAPTHGAGASVRTLCERIVVGQQDEIAAMQRWLRARHLPVPDPGAPHDMAMPGMGHDTLMPGMLTPPQLAQLDAARGTGFDRLFLTFMIQHHQGAITMVEQLLAQPGSTQDPLMFRITADVNADQGSEIDRMQRMLAALPSGGTNQ